MLQLMQRHLVQIDQESHACKHTSYELADVLYYIDAWLAKHIKYNPGVWILSISTDTYLQRSVTI